MRDKLDEEGGGTYYDNSELVNQQFCHRALATESKEEMVETRSMRIKRVREETWDRVESSQGVFIDILSRVSVKSSRSFKTVNKHWHRAISNKYFGKLHLSQSKENPLYIACPRMNTRMKLYSMKPGSFKRSYLNTIYPPERKDKEDMYMISSFNGLICCINQIDEDVEDNFCDLQIWICNPCTGETLLLPQGRPSYESEPSVGVAYGSDISDYRVFRIFCAGKKIPEEKVSGRYFIQEGRLYESLYDCVYECEMYSSSTGVWKNIGPVPCVPMRAHASPYRSSHVFIGGKIYWLVSLDEPGKILSVDLDGTFEVIQLPEYEDYTDGEEKFTDATYLITLHGSLSVVVLHTDCMDVWVWKKNAEKYSWVHVCTGSSPFADDDMILAITSSNNQILCVTQTHWYTYDVDTRIWNRRRAKPAGFVNPALFPFTESVLPCNAGVQP